MLNQPWLEQYPNDVSPEIDMNQYQSLLELFEESTFKYSDQAAYKNMGATLTYRKLEERSRAFAAYLQQELNLKKGDRVAIMMPNLLQYPVALFGILRAGLVVVNVNPLYTARELKHQLKDSDAKAIVVVSNFAKTLEEVVQETSVKHVIVTNLGDLLNVPKRTLVNFVVKYVKKMVPQYGIKYAISMRKALHQGQKLQYIKPVMGLDDLAFLQYTGGTTGISKGAMLTHKNILANILQCGNSYNALFSQGVEHVVTALPLYHIFALTINCLFFIKQGACNLLITNPRDIPAFIQELQKFPFTIITGVNTLFNALMNDPAFKALDFSQCKVAIGGGMAIQQNVAESWQNLTGTPLLEGYGLTECAPLVSCCPHNTEGFSGSIGLPVPATNMRVVDEKGEAVEPNQVGELQVSGPQVMSGYWKRPQETTKVLSEDGWLSTGDLGYMDEKGFFFIVDRKKDMILVSGFNVFPNEVEEVVVSHPKVLEAAAIGIPHEVSGEIVKLFVVAKEQGLTKEQVIQHCKSSLTGYKVPKIVEFRQELPKTNVGKILRRELREEAVR